jgi:hypothetical protein
MPDCGPGQRPYSNICREGDVGAGQWRGCILTCCDKLLVHRVLLLGISDTAEVFLSPVGHGVCLELDKLAQVPIRDGLKWVRKRRRKQTNTACDFGLVMHAVRPSLSSGNPAIR